MSSKVGQTFYVNVGSKYSGQVGYCVEQLSEQFKLKKSKHEDYIKLELDDVVTWFKLSEVTEVVL